MSEKKNIILITVDCLRHDHLSCFGYQRTTSPNIDDLAGRGALFHQAIANGPNTCCSFPSILTSTYPLMNLLGSEEGLPPNWIFLPKENLTIAEVLKTVGYSTAAFHTNPWVSSFFNYDRGFDLFEDFLGKSGGGSLMLRQVSPMHKAVYYLRLLKGLGKMIKKRERDIDIRYLNRIAIRWLKKCERRPFFVWLHYMDVHAPYVPPDPTISELLAAIRIYVEHSRSDKCSSERYLRVLKNFYDKNIMFVDREIGFLLDELEKMGFSHENTYIILTADHGEQFMEHGFVGHGLLYDEVIRVPLIICGPEIEGNIVIKEQVELLDLGPTITDLLKLPQIESFSGESLFPLMKNGKSEKEYVISEAVADTGWENYSFRTGQWKYILLLDRNGHMRREELYDLRSDPREKKNLMERKEGLAKKSKAYILRHRTMEETHRQFKTKPKIDEREKDLIEERLRSLGYM